MHANSLNTTAKPLCAGRFLWPAVRAVLSLQPKPRCCAPTPGLFLPLLLLSLRPPAAGGSRGGG
jgi:hypothetical protein